MMEEHTSVVEALLGRKEELAVFDESEINSGGLQGEKKKCHLTAIILLALFYCCFTGLVKLLVKTLLEIINKISSNRYPFLCTARGSGHQQFVHKTPGGNEKHHK